MNTKLHAVTDTSGRPIRFFLTAGQVSDYTGAAALLSSLPEADWLLADRGYDADWFREALSDRGIRPCIPGRKSRKKLVRYDKRRYKRRNRIERMFGRLKDWRRVATRYDRCPKVFLSAIALAATVIFWLCVLNLEPDVLEVAAQMSQQSRHLADVYSDEKVERAKQFLTQRQEEAEAQQQRIVVALHAVQEIRTWAQQVDLEESVVASQLEQLDEKLQMALPALGYMLSRKDDNVVALAKKPAAE